MIYTFEFLNEIASNLEQSMPPVTEENDGGTELLDLSPSIKIKAAMYLLYNILDDYGNKSQRFRQAGREGVLDRHGHMNIARRCFLQLFLLVADYPSLGT
jgi:hypothetical protein